MGRTLTQLPAVTSVRAAGVTSLITVEGVKSTVAVPFFWVTWIVLLATDAIRPATLWPLPGAGGCAGVWVGADAAPVGLADWAGVLVCELPHAAKDNVVAPAAARIANRAGRGANGLVDIKVPPRCGFHGSHRYGECP